MSNERNNQRQRTTAPGMAPLVGASPSGEALLREGPEPTVGTVVLPVVFIAVFALLVYAAAANINNRGGEFDPRVYYPYANLAAVQYAHPPDPGRTAWLLGKMVYNNMGCVGCHQSNGLGSPGLIPPLAGSEWVLAPGPDRIIRIVLDGASGPIEVNGKQFNNQMIAWRLMLDDEKIAAVLTYVRSEWGNNAPPVTAKQVEKIRAETANHKMPWTAEELKVIAESD